MTLADERRAIAGGITAARKSQQLVSDLQSLESQRRKIGELNELERRGSRPATPGRAVYKAPASSSAGGIASPLVEKTKTEGASQVPDRDYYADGLTSSDGLLILPAIKTLRMTDANGADVEFQLANPKGTL
ncbi:hypothetical protein N5J43_16995 [Pseudomonas nicosulfuronedens]|uniref:hypothetical protein n=1 Tax=Pseudomonas nicosulfuronedens TaxID=2571105 RepID=UPI00244BEC2E|nr:hypothetical protein [Pseudomonas nicosulfuronedens]MDH1011982.1 hypothetical protein [Pseudomonas nicosulfuronedens]MDH1980650.1 hypothetical protein [Pseudomonas nicosulfuronedens]MDH2027600.1 hypothetical protein [Pseudomonas nicosulfuronedens]